MAVTGWKTPGTCAAVYRNEDASGVWQNPDNAKTSNDLYSNAVVNKVTYTHWLRCTNFGFTTSDIPSGATIDGIEVKMERHGQSSSHPPPASQIYDNWLQLRETAGRVGDNEASFDFWDDADEEKTYGGAVDDWNAGLSDSDIRDSGFGLDFAATNSDNHGPYSAYIDVFSIRVYYTEAAVTVGRLVYGGLVNSGLVGGRLG